MLKDSMLYMGGIKFFSLFLKYLPKEVLIVCLNTGGTNILLI